MQKRRRQQTVKKTASGPKVVPKLQCPGPPGEILGGPWGAKIGRDRLGARFLRLPKND